MRVLVVVLAAVMALAGCATIPESASPSTRLQTELKRTRFVVLPRPTPDAVELDVAAVVAELEALERREELVNRVIQPPRRPDLDATVSGGIQSRNLGRALTP